MASCNNEVSVYVARGFDYREVKLRCNSTGPHGELLLCEECEHKRDRIEENSEADNAWLRSAGWGEM